MLAHVKKSNKNLDGETLDKVEREALEAIHLYELIEVH
jgi:hypothetical protein